MEITWYGHACFKLKDDTATIITDPFGPGLGLPTPALNADIVTISHNSIHHNATHLIGGHYKTLNGPGEYEIKEVFITGHHMYPAKLASQDITQNDNVVFVYEVEGITICHLGDIWHVPDQSQVEAFDNVDVLLIPVGGGQSLNAAKAAEVIGIIEPAIVIPMHYHLPELTIPLDPLDKFLKEMGLSQTEPQPKLKVNSSSLPLETQIISLIPTNSK